MARVRKQVAQINVVPMIDVMLVLLVIFMVTAPFINPAQVELPSVGKTSQAPRATGVPRGRILVRHIVPNS
ncbi:MAG TPA: biopolymer transporter ExbD, partial [Thiobacillus sp.]